MPNFRLAIPAPFRPADLKLGTTSECADPFQLLTASFRATSSSDHFAIELAVRNRSTVCFVPVTPLPFVVHDLLPNVLRQAQTS